MVRSDGQMFDLVITGGKVVSPTSTSEIDVAVKGKEVVALAKPGTLANQAKRVINATDLYVLPGAIDPHTHIRHNSPGYPTPGFSIASTGAAHGGTTTFIDFDFPPKAEAKSVQQSIELRRAEADGKVAVDYSLHAALTDPSPRTIQEAEAIIDYGIPSFKVFMSFKGRPSDDGFIFAMLNMAAQEGAIVGFHAENDSLIKYFEEKLLAEGKTDIQFFGQSRPNIVEAEAIRRVIFFAEKTGCSVYIFHLSSKEGLAAVAEAKKRGVPIYCETCTHYLAFTDEVYRQERAIEYLVAPPIRSAEDQAALWDGIIDGTVDCVSTDHVAWFLPAKKQAAEGKRFFYDLPGSFGQIETRLAFMYSEGVATGKITVNRLVEVVSTNVAKIFGLYPQKGIISVGSDADIVLLDPKAKKKITSKDLHMGLDFTIFEGWTFTGLPVMTISKGKVIVEKGRYLGSLSDGQFLKRETHAK